GAEVALKDAREARDLEAAQGYVLRLALAQRHGHDGQMLDECPASLCGWEWRFLRGATLAGPVFDIFGHNVSVNDVASAPGGRSRATADGDGTVRLWDDAGQPRRALRGHTARVVSVAFSPDGRRLVSAGDDGARVWDVGTGQELMALETGAVGPVLRAMFRPGGAEIVGAGRGGRVVVW